MHRILNVHFWGLFLALSGLFSTSGCGPATSIPNSPEVFDIGSLDEVGALYRIAGVTKKSAPTSLGDLAKKKDLFFGGFQSIEKGDIVVYWGVTMTPDGEGGESAEVLAYNSKVPESGGPVLLKNGTIVKMSADTFKSAPKPEGKTSADGKSK